jgi:PAS domain S-box-containing protein
MSKNDDVYRVAFEQSDRAIGLVSLADARFIDANDRFCEFAGRRREELVGSQWSLIAGIDDADLIKSKVEAYANQVGGPFCCHVSIKVNLDLAQLPRLVVIVVEDLKALTEAELKAELRAEELQAVLETVPAGIWFLSDVADRRIIANKVGREWFEDASTPNARFCQLPGYKETFENLCDVNGRVLTPSELPLMRASRGESVRNFVGSFNFKDGRKLDIFGNATPWVDSSGAVKGAVSAYIDISDIRRAEARERLLVREVDHRARNILSVIQAIVQLTKAASVDDFRKGLIGRISSLARVHAIISDSRWRNIDLRQLILEELAPFGAVGSKEELDPRFSLSGPDLYLIPAAAQSLSLTLHELATNAAKYGALTSRKGKIRVDWDWMGEGRDNFLLCWREYDWEPTETAGDAGFGMTLIRTSIEDQLNGKISYHWLDDGLKVEVCCPKDQLTDRSPPPRN